MTLCGSARDTVNQQTGKLNFDNNYIIITIYLKESTASDWLTAVCEIAMSND